MNPFFDPEEQALADRFLSDGYVILPAEDRAGLDRIRAHVAQLAAERLGQPAPNDPGEFLDHIHDRLSVDDLNALRLGVFEDMNAASWFRPAYFRLARQAIGWLTGNELAMQRRVNLSIQMPLDDSSLLPLHADVWAGDSAYELVLWTPLVDCRRTKSMYILPAGPHARFQAEFAERAAEGGVQALFEAARPHLVWLDIPYGHVLLFNQNLAHGNVVNEEATTRWTMNCRFKQLLTPYADKRLGDFFEPITLRPSTRLGADYRFPDIGA
jgi:sporadic carbohydrate cluster 2OG-Fe(II) oxygenase